MVQTMLDVRTFRSGEIVTNQDERRTHLAHELVLTLPSFGRWVSSIWNSETPFGQVSHRQVTVLYLLRNPWLMAGLQPTPSHFAQLLSVRRSVITRVLASLEAGCFVTRIVDPDDARSQIIAITERGEALSIHIEKIFLREMLESIDFLSGNEVEQLLGVLPLLNRLHTNLEQARRQRVAATGANPYEEDGM